MSVVKTRIHIQGVASELPNQGWSRIADFEHLLPYKRDLYKRLEKQGKAPQAVSFGGRIKAYRNEELIEFLKDPNGYKVTKGKA